MSRTSFLIDGFNLYHSCRDIQEQHNIRVKWLNLYSFCSSILPDISSVLPGIGRTATLQDIFYFSAFAHHLNAPGVIIRHEAYIKCLKQTGVSDEMSRFKPKEITCPICNAQFERYEEKETDVAIASKMFELLKKQACDIIVLVSGDTDLCPVVRTCMSLFPDKHIVIAFPYGRRNSELASLAPSFRLKKERYVSNQFPEIVTFSSEWLSIPKPFDW